jgi:hypothetical protein
MVEAISLNEIGKLILRPRNFVFQFYFPLSEFVLESAAGINFSSWLVFAVLIERFAGISCLHYTGKAAHDSSWV